MARFKVGDKVQIRPKKVYKTVQGYGGRLGIVDEIDYTESFKWVRVYIGKGPHLWFLSSEVKHVTD